MSNKEKSKSAEITEKLGTVAPDPRFHTQNCTKWCWASFVDYHKCAGLLSDKNEACLYFEKVFSTICPNAWIEKWTEEIEAGTFPVTFEKKEKKHKENENQ